MQISGKPVIDAKKPLVLSITPADVKKGRKRKPDCCAAAVACIRQLKADQARVYLSRVYIEFPDKWIRYHTPPSLRTEIVSFDRGHTFEAGEYKLKAIKPSITLGKKRKSYARTGKAPQRGNRVKSHIPAGVRARASGWETAAAA